ncbi:hypothetical protein QTP86_019202 [Hemibagrus guttatus]|nr:hypothetical protein QTP86_019202 [Hemibagrus guttatus]
MAVVRLACRYASAASGLDWRTVHRKSDVEFSIVEMSKENGMKSTWTGSALDTLSKNNLCVEKPADFSHSDPRLNRRLVIVDQFVQRDKGGTEEKIIEVKKKINQLEQLYRNTEYYKQVTVLCDVKRKQLDTGGPQQLATLLKEMIDVEQCVHEAIEGVKEKISEAEEKIYQLELHMTSEDFVKVSEFCMYMRAELFWSTLHNDKDSGEAGGGDDEFTEDQRWRKERAEDTELHRGGRDEETSDED